MKVGDYVCRKSDAKYGDTALYKIKDIEGDTATIYWLPEKHNIIDQIKLSELITIPQALELALEYHSEMEDIAEVAIAEIYSDMQDYETDPEKFIKNHIPKED